MNYITLTVVHKPSDEGREVFVLEDMQGRRVGTLDPSHPFALQIRRTLEALPVAYP
jgi:hypothetical protein